jgi:AAA+ ATPase superfamily predicted ATPase
VSNFNDVMFVIGFLGFMGCWMAQFWNVLHKGESWNWQGSLMVFVGVVLSWALVFFGLLNDPTIDLFLTLFNLSNYLFGLSFVFLFIELLFNVVVGSSAGNVKARNLGEERRGS